MKTKRQDYETIIAAKICSKLRNSFNYRIFASSQQTQTLATAFEPVNFCSNEILIARVLSRSFQQTNT